MNQDRLCKFLERALEVTPAQNELFCCQREGYWMAGNNAFVVKICGESPYTEKRREHGDVVDPIFLQAQDHAEPYSSFSSSSVAPSISRLKSLIRANKDRFYITYSFRYDISFNARLLLNVMKALGTCKSDFVWYTGYGETRAEGKIGCWALHLTGKNGEAVVLPLYSRRKGRNRHEG